MKENIYGRNPILETLRAGRRHFFQLTLAQGVKSTDRLNEIIQLAEKKKIPIRQAPRKELDKISDHSQGIALQVSAYPYRDLTEMLDKADSAEQSPFFLLLDTLQDPQNLGTLLRTAEAVGVHGVILPHKRTATVTPAVVAASSGASEHLLIGQANLVQTIDALKQENVWAIGLDGGPKSQPPDKVNLKGGIALVVGSEGQGMRDLVRKSCDILLRLPMHGQIESLNAAVAGSVGLYLILAARE